MENLKTNKISQEALKKASLRCIFALQITWNYEKMQGDDYVYVMLPVLKEIYPDEKELKEAMLAHTVFFNTTPHMAGFIVGVDAATEEQIGIDSLETVSAIKTGLMGPFAGVGDTIFGVLIPTICGSIAAYMALQGSAIGVVIWILVNLCIVAFRYYSTFIGYKQGTKLVTSAKDMLDAITHAATMLGCTVVGALISTVINVPVSATFHSGDVEMALQGVLDQIMPKMLPVALVFFIYWILGKKGMNSTKAIFMVMIAAIVLHLIGFLG